VKITEICDMLENDPALRGRNAQTLSGLEGSSNMGCLSQAWSPGHQIFQPQRELPSDTTISANRTISPLAVDRFERLSLIHSSNSSHSSLKI
jgi:hypothetical protein